MGDQKMPTGNPLMVVYRFMGSTHSLEQLAHNSGAEKDIGKVVLEHGDKKCVIRYKAALLPVIQEHVGRFIRCLTQKISEELFVNGELVSNKLQLRVYDIFPDLPDACSIVDLCGEFLTQFYVDFTDKGKTVYSTPIYYVDRCDEKVTVLIDDQLDWTTIFEK